MRGRRLLAAAGLVAASWCGWPGVPTAQADPVPPVTAAPVAPPEPTVQRTRCATTVATADTGPAAAHRLLDLAAAWEFSRGAGQRVAVIDTGVAPHPRLPRLVAGGDYVSRGDGLADCDSHGTLVAGIIAAAPADGDDFAGVAPAATIISIRQSSGAFAARSADPEADHVGPGYGSIGTLARAVVRAVDLGATVINISEVACRTDGPIADRTLGAAVRYAAAKDVVVVTAAGNLGPGSDCGGENTGAVFATPARFADAVLTVGAVDSETGTPSGFSVHGPWVGVAAPATGVVSLDRHARRPVLVDALASENGPNPLAGTSFAAPYVSGTAALVRARFPDLDAAGVIRRIVATAHGSGAGRDDAIGHGVIDPVAALTAELPDEPGRTVASAAAGIPDPPAPPDRLPTIIGLGGAGLAVVAGLLVVAATAGTGRSVTKS